MGKRHTPSRYLYWSDRGIQRLAEDNGIELEGQRRGQATLTGSIPGLMQAQAMVASRERKTS